MEKKMNVIKKETFLTTKFIVDGIDIFNYECDNFTKKAIEKTIFKMELPKSESKRGVNILYDIKQKKMIIYVQYTSAMSVDFVDHMMKSFFENQFKDIYDKTTKDVRIKIHEIDKRIKKFNNIYEKVTKEWNVDKIQKVINKQHQEILIEQLMTVLGRKREMERRRKRFEDMVLIEICIENAECHMTLFQQLCLAFTNSHKHIVKKYLEKTREFSDIDFIRDPVRYFINTQTKTEKIV